MADKLHYNKEKLVQEYEKTFSSFLQALAVGVGISLAFFLVFVALLGKWHTPHKDFYDTFNDRFTIKYDGQKLPYYDEE